MGEIVGLVFFLFVASVPFLILYGLSCVQQIILSLDRIIYQLERLSTEIEPKNGGSSFMEWDGSREE